MFSLDSTSLNWQHAEIMTRSLDSNIVSLGQLEEGAARFAHCYGMFYLLWRRFAFSFDGSVPGNRNGDASHQSDSKGAKMQAINHLEKREMVEMASCDMFSGNWFMFRKKTGVRCPGMGDASEQLDLYKDADFIIFNTGHWWTHEKTALGYHLVLWLNKHLHFILA
ncbi:hypothetical protein ACJX0J_036344 [Zea mays]